MPICNKNNKIRCQSSAVHDVSNAFITQLLRNAPNMRLRQQIHRWKRRARTNTSTPWAGRCLDVPTTSDSTLISHCRPETCAAPVRLVCPRACRRLACCEWWSSARCSTRNTINVNVPPSHTLSTTYLTVLFAQQRSKVGCGGERVLRVGRALMHRAHKSIATEPVLALCRLSSSTMVVFFFNKHTSICACPVSYTHLTLPTICSV